ncbi:MAG: alpha/beta hydrolase [Opitutaceae bacterium]
MKPHTTPPPPDQTEIYVSRNGNDLPLDLYLPVEGTGNGAGIILIHGGGWHAGERQTFRWHAHHLSSLGYVALTIDYRLAPASPYPAAVEDCLAAVVWLRRQAARFGIDSNRIGAIGSSAGGHLAACLGVIGGEVDGIPTRVDHVVDIHGIHDFLALRDASGGINPNWMAFLGGTHDQYSRQWRAASPALRVNTDSASMLIVHDPEDPIVPYEQSRLLVDALVQAGRPVQFIPSPGSGHGFIYNPEHPWTVRIWPSVVNWLNRELRVSGRSG